MSKDYYSMIQKAGKGMVADGLDSVKKNMLTLPSPSLNWALGGGLAYGKIVTVYGPEQAGKTLIAQLAIAELHKTNPNAWALWFDAEFSFDKDYAIKLGIDVKRLWLIQSNKPSDIFDYFFDTVWPMVQDGFPLKIMVIDSIKSIRGPKEADKDSVEDQVMGDISQLLNKAFRKILEPIRKEKILTFCVQQVNEEFDQMKRDRGIKYHLPSGFSLKHFSDYIILVEKVDSKASKMFDETHKNIQALPIQVGHTVRCKVEKNRTDSPHLVAEFRLKYGVGVVDQALEVARVTTELHIVNRPTAVTYEFQGHKAQGFQNFVDKVKSTPELYRALIAAFNAYDVFALNKPEVGITKEEEKNPQI